MTTTTTTGDLRQGEASQSGLEAFKLCGMNPFWSAGDCADTHREQAFALLTLMADAFHGAEGEDLHPITTIRPRIIGEALQGIAALVALSQHASDCADSKRLAGSVAR